MAINGNHASPKITLYTSHTCPWAHRLHIILNELALPFEEHIIDLDVPRPQWYLDINPRGVVPTLIYDGDVLSESAVVAQFLADTHPGRLLKGSTEAGGALQRARVNFFVDTWVGKVNPWLMGSFRAQTDAERSERVEAMLAALTKEIEPRLEDAAPFFGRSEKLTFAEVLTGSFVLRMIDFPTQGLLPADLPSRIEASAPCTYRWAMAVAAHPSVNSIWNAEKMARVTRGKVAQMLANKKNMK